MRAFIVTRPGHDPETAFFKDHPKLDAATARAHLIARAGFPDSIQVSERALTPQDRGIIQQIQPPTPSEIAAGLAREAHRPTSILADNFDPREVAKMLNDQAKIGQKRT